MQQRPGFTWGTLSMGTKTALITGLLAFINFFLPWNKYGGGDVLGLAVPGVNVNGFNGIGTFAAILVIALLVWEGLYAAGALANVAVPKKLVTAILAGAAGLFTLLRFLIRPAGDPSYQFGSWIGLILALALGYVAWINWQEHQTTVGGAMPPPMPPQA